MENLHREKRRPFKGFVKVCDTAQSRLTRTLFLLITAAEDLPTSQTPATEVSAVEPKKEQAQKEMSEKERRRLERLYRLGDKAAILIHPNRTARGGRFDCHRVSLHSLLNYPQSDEQQKELNFEVCLFAEQFNTMMQRDCAFTIFKGVYSAPEKDGKYEIVLCLCFTQIL